MNRSYFVVQLKERETPDLTQFEADKDSLRRTGLNVKQSRVYREWLRHLRRGAQIEYNPALFPPVIETAAEG